MPKPEINWKLKHDLRFEPGSNKCKATSLLVSLHCSSMNVCRSTEPHRVTTNITAIKCKKKKFKQHRYKNSPQICDRRQCGRDQMSANTNHCRRSLSHSETPVYFHYIKQTLATDDCCVID